MSNAFKSARQKILAHEPARDSFFTEVMRRRRERRSSPAAREGADKPERMKALYERIGYNPDDHPALEASRAPIAEQIEATADNARTYGELQRLIHLERLQKKAARARLRELGIR